MIMLILNIDEIGFGGVYRTTILFVTVIEFVHF